MSPDLAKSGHYESLCLLSASGGYCCKSRKLPGDISPAIKRFDRRPPICVASITLPRSPASLSSGDEVPHIFTRKSRLKPGEFFATQSANSGSVRLTVHQRKPESGFDLVLRLADQVVISTSVDFGEVKKPTPERCI